MQQLLLDIEPLIPALRRYARALLRDRSSADDLVQDCLERAIGRWPQRRDGEVRPWLFAILHNLAIDRFRQKATRGIHVPIDATNENAFGEAASQDSRLMFHDVLNKLATLPDDQRAVLLLIAVEDLSYTEAAKVLDIPVGTVMSRLSRARERLQRELDGTPAAAGNVLPLRSIK